jgi:YidC/Oxa1 family membrane protein insertase
MNDNRNLFVAIALSALLLIGWQYFVAAPQLKAEQERQALQAAQQKKLQPAPSVAAPELAPNAPEAVHAAPIRMSRAEALKRSGPRIAIRTPTMDGSLRLTGARFDDLKLKNYHATIDPRSPEIDLLAPFNSDFPYFVQFEWRGSNSKIALPNGGTPWKLVQGSVLSPGHPVKLSWDNGQGFVFTRPIGVDEK